MFASEILEIVIGLVFIYLLLSLLGTTVNELISGLLSLRGRNLKKSLVNLLNDEKNEVLFYKFIEHPMFRKLRKDKKKRYPSYLSESKFSKILLESFSEKGKFPQQEDITGGLEKLPLGPTKEILQSFWIETAGDITAFRGKIEDWFEEVQCRASGWYKRNTQIALLVIGFIIAGIFNADTLSIINKLSTDSKARKSLVELSIKQSAQLQSSDYLVIQEMYRESDWEEVEGELEIAHDEEIDPAVERIEELNDNIHNLLDEQLSATNKIMGMSWKEARKEIEETRESGQLFAWTLKKLVGFIITAFAISLGANFWFDLLNKAIKIRNSGGLPEKKSDKKKNER